MCVFIPALLADDASDDGNARVMLAASSSAASIADDTLTLSFSDVGTPVTVVDFFRPGHGIHHWPKNSLIKVATVPGRTCLSR